MAGDDAGEPVDVRDLDFDALYRGESPIDDLDIGVPWDIGEAQPDIVAAEEAGGVVGDVLDAGSGPGENAIFLASRGYRVTGLDLSPTAVEQARERARTRGVHAEFAVADLTDLTGYADRFDTVIDSGVYHTMDEEVRRRYVAELYRATRPGARLHLLAFSDAVPERFPGPFRITAANLRATLESAGWTIAELRRSTLAAVMPEEAAARFDISVERDASGHIHVPTWYARADRA